MRKGRNKKPPLIPLGKCKMNRKLIKPSPVTSLWGGREGPEYYERL
jgi:hypothetical protein